MCLYEFTRETYEMMKEEAITTIKTKESLNKITQIYN